MDQSTFERLYCDLLPGLYRMAQSLLHHPADAQDAVQQAAVKAWQHRERMRPGSERAYFMRIVINECRNIQRHRQRVLPVDVLPERADGASASGLTEAIGALPEKLRLPLLLKYMEGCTEREAADALRISVPALKSRLYRAQLQLQKLLNEEVGLE